MLDSEIFQGKMWKCLLRKVYSHVSKQKWKTRETWKTLDKPLKTLDENEGEERGNMHLVHYYRVDLYKKPPTASIG